MGKTYEKYMACMREKQQLQERVTVLEADNSTLSDEVLRLTRLTTPPLPPATFASISREELKRIYLEIFPGQKDLMYFGDSWYKITSIDEIRRFVTWSNVDEFGYLKYDHDCDDFAKALAGEFAKYPQWSGFPVTDIWGEFLGGHAILSVIAWPSVDERIALPFWIEPQNDWEYGQESIEGCKLWLLAHS